MLTVRVRANVRVRVRVRVGVGVREENLPDREMRLTRHNQALQTQRKRLKWVR